MSAYWYALDYPNPTPSLEEVGGKGFSLIKCRKGGFTVPEGFVLSVSFFEPWLQKIQATAEYKAVFSSLSNSTTTTQISREACDAIKAHCSTLELNYAQQQSLDVAIYSIFDETTKLCSVRSSAPHEDSAKASFAGIYHTTLGVRLDDNEALLNALRDSFASAFDFRIVSISFIPESEMNFRLAIVIQRQLDSQSSGVAFSLDPQSNCYDEAVICANRGLGETVVAGTVTPDTYKVDKVKQCILAKEISATKNIALTLRKDSRGGVEEQAINEPTLPALSDDQILEVSLLTTQVEEYMGFPVDIEWAYDDGKLFLLQARPITIYFKLFPEMVTPPGASKHLYFDFIVATQGISESMSVLGLDMWGRMLREAKPHLTPGPNGTIWEIHGRQYLILSNMLSAPMGDKMVKKMMSTHGGNFGRMLDTLNLKSYRPLKSTAKNRNFLWSALGSVFHCLPNFMEGIIDREKALDPYVNKADEILDRFSFGGAEEERDITLDQAVDDVMAAFRELIPLLGGFYYWFFSKWRLMRIFAGDDEALDLLVALNMDLNGNPTSEMGHFMLRLASSPEVQEVNTSSEFLQKLKEKKVSEEFMNVYTDFIKRFGCRGFGEIDIVTPRSDENQEELFQRIKQIDVENNQILTVKKRKENAYNILLEKAKLIGCQDGFCYHANIVQKLGGYREHPKYVYVFLISYLRRRALKLSDRFLKEGRITTRASIFDLKIKEITKAETEREMNLLECINMNNSPRESVGIVREWPALIDSRGRIPRSERTEVDGGLGGDPISPGTVVGRARVLTSPYEKPLTRGEILVTRATEPSWTPIFLNASGVVLEVGGLLQHGAIIAREYGIPCVSGVDQATKVICDGQMIRVDGTKGTVHILDAEDP